MTEISMKNVMIKEDGTVEGINLNEVVARAIKGDTRANISIIVEPLAFNEIEIKEVEEV